MRSLISLFLLVLVANVQPVVAGPMQAFVFDDPEQEAVFKRLSHEIRCLVCQNQAIADSNAGLAKDLREEIYNMLKQGKTETEITEFLVERYGDFVLYDPPMKPATFMLWFGPLIMFFVALFFAFRFISSHRVAQVSESSIDTDDEARLKELQQQARNELDKD